MRHFPILKSSEEIDSLRVACRAVAIVHEAIAAMLVSGISTMDIELEARNVMIQQKTTPAFLGYAGFPAVCCISVNEEIVHGIPSKQKILQEGDVISIDLGALINGFYGDAARTYCIGKTNEKRKILVEATYEGLMSGIAAFQEGNTLADITNAVYSVAKKHNLGVVYQYCGHGIGRALHEDPPIFNCPMDRAPNFILQEGMVFAIEPMFTLGVGDTVVHDDGWTVISADASCAAHWEHTVALTKNGPEILTCI